MPDSGADGEDAPDFYTLVLGATLGMCLMASANHLLIVFLGVEMASVPSYALAGMLKGRRQSSEAALKYAIYGAGAAESVWGEGDVVLGDDDVEGEWGHAVTLGARYGFDVGGVQFVPGLAWMPAVDDAPTRSFIYLSIEHGF